MALPSTQSPSTSQVPHSQSQPSSTGHHTTTSPSGHSYSHSRSYSNSSMAGFMQQQRNYDGQSGGNYSHSPHQSLSNPAAVTAGGSSFNSVTAPAVNQTRILLLSSFSPSLKTRDIHQLFSEWDTASSGGFKIKWRDDASCWVVFADAVTAKRAYLSLLASPPPALQPQVVPPVDEQPGASSPADSNTDSASPSKTTSEASTPTDLSSNATKYIFPKLEPYAGSDAATVLAAVQNRPRSRSNAGATSTSATGAVGQNSGATGNGVAPGGHSRRSSSIGGQHGRAPSFGGGGADNDASAPPLPSWRAGASSPEQRRSRSPELSRSSAGGANAGAGSSGHRRVDSRSAGVASAVEGLTIHE